MRRVLESVTGRLLAAVMVVGGVALIAVSLPDIKRYLKLRAM